MHEKFEDYVEMARSLLAAAENDNDLMEANEYVNLALKAHPNDAGAWMLKSQLLSALQDDPAALAAAEMAVRYSPRHAEARYVHATVLVDMERFGDALRALAHAFRFLRTKTDDWLVEDLYYEKALALDALGRTKHAIATIELGLKKFPDSELLSSGLVPLKQTLKRSSLRVITGGRS